jgi:hypothetical protein
MEQEAVPAQPPTAEEKKKEEEEEEKRKKKKAEQLIPSFEELEKSLVGEFGKRKEPPSSSRDEPAAAAANDDVGVVLKGDEDTSEGYIVDSDDAPDLRALKDQTSLMLTRNVMDSLSRGDKTDRLLHESRRVLSQRVRSVRVDIVDQMIHILDHFPLFNIAVRKLWQSICPNGMDMYTEWGPLMSKPTQWFQDFVVNRVWVEELQNAYYSLIVVGYYAVTYSPSPENPEMLTPHVLDPQQYRVWWTIDQNGRRYWRITPRNLPVSLLNKEFITKSEFESAYHQKEDGGTEGIKGEGNTNSNARVRKGIDLATGVKNAPYAQSASYWQVAGNNQFEAVDFYVDPRGVPTDDGRIRSRAMNCLESIIQISNMHNSTLRLLDQLSNMPLVTQCVTPNFVTDVVRGMTGTGPVSASTVPRGGPTPSAPQDVMSIPMAEDSLALPLFRYSAASAASAYISREIRESTIDRAAARAAVMPIKMFDELSDVVYWGTHRHPWMDSHIALPPGTQMAAFRVPDVQKSLADLRQWLTASICNALEVPPELVLGSHIIRVSTSAITQEALGASVLHWRKDLCTQAEMMYWRIYGAVTLVPYVRIFEDVNIEITEEFIRDFVMDMAVRFSFRNQPISATDSVKLYKDGVITRSAMMKRLSEVYGFEFRDFVLEDPPLPQQQQPNDHKRGHSSSKGGGFGDGGDTEGFGKQPTKKKKDGLEETSKAETGFLNQS